MTLWKWVAFMDYPTKTESSPAEPAELKNGSDFTEMLDEKRTEFTKAKQEKPVAEQDELLEMMRSIFVKTDKEDLLSLLVELEEIYDVSWKDMLTADRRADTELRETLPKKEVADEHQFDKDIMFSKEEQHRLDDLIQSLPITTDKEDVLSLLAELQETNDISWKAPLPAEERADMELHVTPPNKEMADEHQLVAKVELSEDEQHRLGTLIRALFAKTENEEVDKFNVFVQEEAEEPVESLQENNTKFPIGEAYYYPENVKGHTEEKNDRADSLVEIMPKTDLVETILTLIHSLPKQVKEELRDLFTSEMEQIPEFDSVQIAEGLPQNFPNNITVNRPVDFPELESEVNELFAKIEQQLMQVKTQEDAVKAAPKVLEYLMAWQQLSGKAGNHTELMPLVIRGGNQQTPVMWQDLVKLYQQKMNFHTKSVYALESKVTNTDIVRWLSNTLNMTVHQEQPIATPQAQTVQMPISQVEQMVIQLPQNSDNNQAGKALLEQFNRFIDTKSLASQQLKGQLAITLKPANLGEMLVRFTQVDGEMLVKIMVTTKAAKEMLEANSQQLRHMFAPHQVVIERNDPNVQQAQAAYKEEGQAEKQEQDDQSSSGNQQEKDDNETFASLFDELILNEKV